MAKAKRRILETKTADRIVVHPEDLHNVMTSRGFESAHSYRGAVSGEVGRFGQTRVFVSIEAPRYNWSNKPMPVEVSTVIDLELTDGDADFLIALLSVVGGNPRKSPRKYAERIGNALKAATGMEYDRTDAFGLMGHIGGGQINFKNYADPGKGSHSDKNRAKQPAAAQPDLKSVVDMFAGWRHTPQDPFRIEPRPMFSHPALYDVRHPVNPALW